MPVFTALASQHKALQLDLRFSDQIADVVDEQIDLGVRIGLVKDNTFIVRQVAQVGFSLVASPALVARDQVPDNLEH